MKKTIARISITILLLLYSSSVYADEIQLEIKGLEEGIVQGNVALISVTSSVKLTSLSTFFDGKKLSLISTDEINYTTLLGIDMDKKPDEYPLRFSASSLDNNVIRKTVFTVLPRKYKVEKLSLPEKMVKPDSATLKRTKREGRMLRNVWVKSKETRLWSGEFMLPVDGTVANNFGARRILNGVKKNPHTGVDVKAYKGKKIVSPNDGKVALVDNLYYGGKTIIIDHGEGLYTSYMHLSKILVNHGEEVKKGDRIGLVGATGRATGPHLHWSARLNYARIDPVSLLELFKKNVNKNNNNVANNKDDDKVNLVN